MKRTYIAWIPYHRRAELLAQYFGATLHFVFSGRSGRLLKPPVKYLAQALHASVRYPISALRTWIILCQELPEVIFVQNPPIICVLLVYLYTKLHKARYIIDSHTGAFLSRKWRWSLGLHRFLSRHAFMTIVHNKSQEETIKQWGCPYCVIAYTPGEYPSGEPYPLSEHFNVAVVSSFDGDEPHHTVFAAAKQLPGAIFYITGNPKQSPDIVSLKPENCVLTGYLSFDRYVGLLRGVDVIMVLTTVNHQLLMGGFEAVSLGQPLIVSDWPVLRDYFHLGTVHVLNTLEGICEGVRRAQRNLIRLREEMLVLQQQLKSEWEEAFDRLRLLLENCDESTKQV